MLLLRHSKNSSIRSLFYSSCRWSTASLSLCLSVCPFFNSEMSFKFICELYDEVSLRTHPDKTVTLGFSNPCRVLTKLHKAVMTHLLVSTNTSPYWPPTSTRSRILCVTYSTYLFVCLFIFFVSYMLVFFYCVPINLNCLHSLNSPWDGMVGNHHEWVQPLLQISTLLHFFFFFTHLVILIDVDQSSNSTKQVQRN